MINYVCMYIAVCLFINKNINKLLKKNHIIFIESQLFCLCNESNKVMNAIAWFYCRIKKYLTITLILMFLCEILMYHNIKKVQVMSGVVKYFKNGYIGPNTVF